MVRRTKRRGGMMQVLRPLGKATVILGKSIGKDYLQKKSGKVAQGIFDDPSRATDPGFILTGKKTVQAPNIKIHNNENVSNNVSTSKPPTQTENMFDNLGGRTRRKYKKRKTRKNRK